jgi:hypothetical protein
MQRASQYVPEARHVYRLEGSWSYIIGVSLRSGPLARSRLHSYRLILHHPTVCLGQHTLVRRPWSQVQY